MGKRMLITSTDLMMIQFLVPHVRNLIEHGYEIDIACSDVGGRMDEIRSKLIDCVTGIYEIRLKRSPLSFLNLKGYQDMKKVINGNQYDIIWTNEPVMGAATRIAARKTRGRGTTVVYIVHGFHFYKGAPMHNWMFFYPAEKMLARITDYIVTVNKEDYKRAGKFPVKKIYYIHGIGANTDKLQKNVVSENIRKKMKIPENAFLILSVGELNANKNQKVIIDAMAELKDDNIYYIVCGSGKNLKRLRERSEKYGIQDKIRFVDYRRDVINFYDQADIFALSSYREGLPIALLEAMYCGVSPVTSDIRGVRDIMQNGVTGITCNPKDSHEFAEAIRALKENRGLREKYGKNSRKAVRPYMLSLVKDRILDIFEEIEGEDNGD